QRQSVARGDLRAGRRHPDLQLGGRGDQTRQRYRVWSGRLSLHPRHGSRHARIRAARSRHDRPQPRARLRSGGAVRRHEAVRHRPRRRARGAARVHGDAVHFGELVSVGRGLRMDVLMPQLGETVAEGKISKWFVSAGDAVKPGDNLFEIETDKVSMEVPAITAGTLAEIRVSAGEVAPVGTVGAVIQGKGETASLSK